MAISAKQVKELRDRTGAGMMDCKKALIEVDGDIDAAVEFLQKKGMAKAAKKAGRTAAEGLVAIHAADDGSAATLVEVNCETDFVARNDAFVSFAARVAELAFTGGHTTLDSLLAADVGDGKSVADWTTEQVASIGENIQIRRLSRIEANEGIIGQYVHAGAQIGVVVEIGVAGADDDTAAAFAKDIAMHVAASNPQVTRADDIPSAELDKQREILTAQALESGKPANIVEKMVEGRIRKWKAEITLLDQPFVKDPDLSVAKHQKATGGVEIRGFVRFQVGEGIEKEQTSLADEVAQQLKG